MHRTSERGATNFLHRAHWHLIDQGWLAVTDDLSPAAIHAFCTTALSRK